MELHSSFKEYFNLETFDNFLFIKTVKDMPDSLPDCFVGFDPKYVKGNQSKAKVLFLILPK